ncbi:hypothetical protein PTT_11220 [Pyrenophora teres f. teres 0-1]|uniref:Uncharacterized protein n=1 Tax=Pyrenophora teres f. teres (strain 0-1) TaxID=861557 RepID=E3RR17_PYRTT|nr:hypothetical protein PTT_11220 [Pyrenophora teres f. teres 0-1]
MTKRKTRKRKRIQHGGTMERLVVVVIKKEPNQLYGAVETVEGLDTTRELAKKIQRHLLD